MTRNNFEYISDTEIKKRSLLVKNFLEKILHKEELPMFISDEARLFDLSSDLEQELITKIARLYGVKLTSDHLQLKLWQLVDLIYK